MSILSYTLITVLVVFGLPLIVIIVAAWRSRSKTTGVSGKQSSEKTLASTKTAPVKPVSEKPGDWAAFADVRFWIAAALLSVLFTFKMDLFWGGVPYKAYSIPNGMLYIPLAGLLYYGLAWSAVACLWTTLNEKFNILILLFILAFGGYVFIGGFINNWHMPFMGEHNVIHALGTIPFMGDPLFPWWVVAVGTAFFYYVATRHITKMGAREDFPITLFIVCLFLPQALQKIFS